MKNTTGMRVHFDNTKKMGNGHRTLQTLGSRKIRRLITRTKDEAEREYLRFLLNEREG